MICLVLTSKDPQKVHFVFGKHNVFLISRIAIYLGNFGVKHDQILWHFPSQDLPIFLLDWLHQFALKSAFKFEANHFCVLNIGRVMNFFHIQNPSHAEIN